MASDDVTLHNNHHNNSAGRQSVFHSTHTAVYMDGRHLLGHFAHELLCLQAHNVSLNKTQLKTSNMYMIGLVSNDNVDNRGNRHFTKLGEGVFIFANTRESSVCVCVCYVHIAPGG